MVECHRFILDPYHNIDRVRMDVYGLCVIVINSLLLPIYGHILAFKRKLAYVVLYEERPLK